MCVVAEIVDEVGCDAHDNERTDPVQHVVCGEERTMHFVRANSGRTVVGVGVSGASHCELLLMLIVEKSGAVDRSCN
jgi:hypothetical protein